MMFIRTQSRLSLVDLNNTLQCFDDRNTICYGGGFVLGLYKSKERCLEIMDDICDAIENNQAIYYMPEE